MTKQKKELGLWLHYGMMEMADEKSPEKWAFELTHILNAFHNEHERFPVDVKTLTKQFSNQKYPNEPITMVKGAALVGFEGGLVKNPSSPNEWGIIYNDSIQSKGRINYTLAHEFGHYLLHRKQYPDGIQCGTDDLVKWGSKYGQIENEANIFAATLLMPLDDYRKQIDARDKVDLDMLGYCADRYDVSLIAVTLRWIQYTERRAILVVSRDGYALWARSSKSAYRSGIYIKTSNVPPVLIPQNSLSSKSFVTESQKQAIELPPGVWFDEPCEEMVIFSELYDFTISLVLLENL